MKSTFQAPGGWDRFKFEASQVENGCHNFSVINSIECQLFVYKLFVYNAQRTAVGGRGGGRQVETEGQTGLDTDQQVPARNLKAAGEATSI